MKGTIISFALILCAVFSHAQLENKIGIFGAYSGHGVEDLTGFKVSAYHEHAFNPGISMLNGFSTSIHWGKNNGFNNINPGVTPENYLMKFTTAGFQLQSSLQAYIIKGKVFNFSFDAGPIIRFQSSSVPEIYGFHQNADYYPEPFYVISDNSTANSLAVGYDIGVTVRKKLDEKIYMGIRASYQNDSQANSIFSVGLIFEKIVSTRKIRQFK
jgi:hypothetical protein